MEKEYGEVEEELEKSHKELDGIVDKNIPKSEQNKFYKVLNEVIDNEIEMEKFCNQ